jgi:hypothetical protein
MGISARKPVVLYDKSLTPRGTYQARVTVGKRSNTFSTHEQPGRIVFFLWYLK